jgi:hypothetical protein
MRFQERMVVASRATGEWRRMNEDARVSEWTRDGRVDPWRQGRSMGVKANEPPHGEEWHAPPFEI